MEVEEDASTCWRSAKVRRVTEGQIVVCVDGDEDFLEEYRRAKFIVPKSIAKMADQGPLLAKGPYYR